MAGTIVLTTAGSWGEPAVPLSLAIDAAGALTLAGQTVTAVNAGAGSTINADSASLTDVQAAVNAASDGDTVLIPNGTVTWTGGISTTKQIIIRAQNYTPTSMGTMTRNVVITHNAGTNPLIAMTSGNTSHCGVGGIRFNAGTGTGNHVSFTGSGSKVPLLFDCSFLTDNRPVGAADEMAHIRWLALGGVAWNLYLDGRSYPVNPSTDIGNDIAKASIHLKSPRLWTTASTMGNLDTNGDQNVYVEDSTFKFTTTPDADDHARLVIRYSLIDGMRSITHGFTSLYGGRFIEFYNNTFSVSERPRNMAGYYVWNRAGTMVFADNVVNNTINTSDYGNISLLLIGESFAPSGSYPINRQPGGGHNGTSYVIDPIYMWGNTGARQGTYGMQGGWDSVVQLNRDLFTNTEKPGYSKYTYPHPFRSVI
jgi:hypothetical protein